MVATALTPPHIATANAAKTPARRGDPPRAPCTSGSKTHGATAEGHASIEVGPSRVNVWTDSAKANPASTRPHGDPQTERTAELDHADERDAQQQRPPESLRHPWRELKQVADREERTHRPEVAVGLVLHLPEGAQRVPEVQGPAEEAPGILGQVPLGIGDDPPGLLDERGRRQQEAVRRHP